MACARAGCAAASATVSEAIASSALRRVIPCMGLSLEKSGPGLRRRTLRDRGPQSRQKNLAVAAGAVRTDGDPAVDREQKTRHAAARPDLFVDPLEFGRVVPRDDRLAQRLAPNFYVAHRLALGRGEQFAARARLPFPALPALPSPPIK